MASYPGNVNLRTAGLPSLPKSSPYFKGSGLMQAVQKADRLTGASQLASGAYWSVTHPVDRLTGKGRAAGPQYGEVPWVAGRPWFHGSARVFEKFDPKRADPHSLYGPGHYITDDPKLASSYTEKGANPLVEQGNYVIGRQGAVSAPFQRDFVFRDLRRMRDNKREVWGVEPKLTVNRRTTDNGQRLVEYDIRHPEYGPNVTRYSFEPDKVFDIREPATPAVAQRLVKAILALPENPHNPVANWREAAGREVEALARGRDIEGRPAGPVALNGLWHALVGRMGTTRANEVIRRAGYDAIAYPGGAATGGRLHNALVVLNDAPLKRGGQPNPQYAGTPRPVHRRNT